MGAIKPGEVEVLPPERRFPGSGRRKGVPNKMTRLAKEAIALAFEEVGGVEALVKWIKKDPQNQRDFYVCVYPKLLPLDVRAEVTNKIVGLVTFRGLDGN